MHSGTTGDTWEPERNLPDNFSELLIVTNYSGTILSITLTKVETDSSPTTMQKATGWYTNVNNNGCLFVTYIRGKYSVHSFHFIGSAVTATCAVYYH